MNVEKIYSVLIAIIAQKNNVVIKTDFKRKEVSKNENSK